MEKIYYLYQITNRVNGKIYVGAHQTLNLEDGYMGSGTILKAAISKYGVENFEKKILEVFKSEKEMFEREAKIVTTIFIAREDNYNLIPGGRRWDDQGSDKANERRRWLLENDPEFRRAYSKKLSESVPAPTKEHQQHLAESNRKNKKGAFHNPDVRLEMCQRAQSPEAIAKRKATRERMKFMQGANNSMYGRCWVYNEGLLQSITIKKEELEVYLSKGWKKGRKINLYKSFAAE